MLRFILGLPIDAACKVWLAFRWLVLSPGMGMQETFPARLIIIRSLIAWAASACVLPSLFPPLPLGAAALIAVGVGPLAAAAVTVAQAFAQCTWAEWSGKY